MLSTTPFNSALSALAAPTLTEQAIIDGALQAVALADKTNVWRAFYLAAHAAYRAGKYEDCLTYCAQAMSAIIPPDRYDELNNMYRSIVGISRG